LRRATQEMLPVERSNLIFDSSSVTDLETSSSADRFSTPCLTAIPLTLSDADQSCPTPVRLSIQVGWKVPSPSTAMPVVWPPLLKKGGSPTRSVTNPFLSSILAVPIGSQIVEAV